SGKDQSDFSRGLGKIGEAAKFAGQALKDNFGSTTFGIAAKIDINLIKQIGEAFRKDIPPTVEFKSALDQLTGSLQKTHAATKKYVDLTKAGGIVIPGNVRPIDITGPSASQKNTWFDRAINIALGDVQDIKTAQGRIAALKKIRDKVWAEIKRVHDP